VKRSRGGAAYPLGEMLAVRLSLAAAALLGAAAPASAATVELGGVAPAGAASGGCSGCSFVQASTAPGAPSYRVPAGGGVITEWRARGGSSVEPGDRVRLRVFRPGAPSGGYVLAVESADAVPLAGQAGAYATRLRVEAGDVLGLRLSTAGSTTTMFEAAAGNVVGTWFSDPAPGLDTGYPFRSDARRVNVAARMESDADRDGRGDVTQDSDDDNDGLSDGREDELGSDPLRADTDRDGVRDGRDVCVLVVDRAQVDAELDGSGDACDRDDDNDGISDDAEAFRRTSRVDRDTDDDGLSDSKEDRLDTDPRRADTDRDGLLDGQEMGARRGAPDPPGLARGTDLRRFRRDMHPRSHTSPRARDTDRDGLSDGREDRNRNGRRDRGETDPRRRDSDGDAVPDGAERFPLDPRR
jgi:thrombospondin type 3 repeat protein